MAVFVSVMNGATFRAVYGACGDMCVERGKLTLCAAGCLRHALFIPANKPENEFFVTIVSKEGNIQLQTTADGVVKTVEAQGVVR